MRKKFKISMIIILFLGMICYGVALVNIRQPEIVRNQSKFKITFHKNPFHFQMDMGDYIVYVNSQLFNNIKEDASKVFSQVKEKTVDAIKDK